MKVILVRPQLSNNIGAVARAMLNFGCEELRLVNPREASNWLDENAIAMAAGAASLLHKTQIYNNLVEATADLNLLLALTVRSRDINKQVINVNELNTYLKPKMQQNIGLIFGPENSGLSNEDLVFAHNIIHIPTNPNFSSLNIAQAVAITLHEIFGNKTKIKTNIKNLPNANMLEVNGFFDHLEKALDVTGFLSVAEKKASMLRNIKNIFMRTENLSSQEISTLRGIITALASK